MNVKSFSASLAALAFACFVSGTLSAATARATPTAQVPLATVACIRADDGTPTAVPSSGTPIAPLTTKLSTLAEVIAVLEDKGARVDTAVELTQPFFNASTVTRLVLSGGTLSSSAELQVYEYDDPAVFGADVTQVTPDGNLETVMIMWVASPHFFCGENTILLYVGDDPEVVELLTDLLGPQFAGR